MCDSSKQSALWKHPYEWSRSEREYADYILEAFLYHLEISTKLAFASLSSCLSRIKVGVFKDRLFYIFDGFSVEMVFTNQVNPTPSKGISRNVIDLGN